MEQKFADFAKKLSRTKFAKFDDIKQTEGQWNNKWQILQIKMAKAKMCTFCKKI